MTATDAFAQSAVAFCTWATSKPANVATEAAHATRLLASLYARALDLRETPLGAFGEEQPTKDEWTQVFRRGAALPFDYYSCADPSEVPTDVVMIGDLADDVADIWADLTAGLRLYGDGRIDEAETEWKVRFDSHWGRHAADALAALQAWHQRALST